MAKIESWVEQVFASEPTCWLQAFGMTTWKREVDRDASPYAGNSVDQCMRLHRRFTEMRKNGIATRVEFGMARHYTWKMCWPYAAIASADLAYLLIPGAQCCPYFITYSLPNPTGKGTGYRGLRMFEDMIPINTPVTAGPVSVRGRGEGRAIVNRDQIARRGDVRPGDCYLYDLTRKESPRVRCEGLAMGRAVQFGALDEIIDTVRCRLVFAGLPSA